MTRFQRDMARRMRGEFTPEEKERLKRAQSSYQIILKNHGGKNPLFA